MTAGIISGEGFDWHFASASAREARVRSPITDGAAGKPWVFRSKDIQSWWENSHFDRRSGAELTTPSAWIPHSKPVWFTELGCAAVDKGGNQPNVFSDPKSSVSAKPYFSNGGRSDLTQMRFLASHLDHWSGAANPVSPVYGGAMVDASNLYLWAWDARPFPAFPLLKAVWTDGGNWLTGHWLNGRLGGMTLGDLISAILIDHGVPASGADDADGFLEGYVIGEATTAREALEPLITVWPIDVSEEDGSLKFRSRSRAPDVPHLIADTLYPAEGGPLAVKLIEIASVPRETILGYRDPLRSYQAATAAARTEAGEAGTENVDLPIMLDPGMADALAGGMQRDRMSVRKQIAFSAPWREAALAPGDRIAMPDLPGEAFRIMRIEDGAERRIEAVSIVSVYPLPAQSALPELADPAAAVSGPPLFYLIDLPVLPGGREPANAFKLAVWTKPWRSQAVFASPSAEGFTQRGLATAPAVTGVLVNALNAGETGRYDFKNRIMVRLSSGELQGVSNAHLLNGANTALVQGAAGCWEVLQFLSAVETTPDIWELWGLLRGQLGTEDAAGAAAGAAFVLLDSSVADAGLTPDETGVELHWRVGAAGKDFTSQYFAEKIAAGGLRALMPLSPTHLSKTEQEGGDAVFSWIRRSRVNADTWLGSDVSLGEASESFRIRLLNVSGGTVRESISPVPQWTWTPAMQIADTPLAPVAIEIAQISEAIGAGIPAVLAL